MRPSSTRLLLALAAATAPGSAAGQEVYNVDQLTFPWPASVPDDPDVRELVLYVRRGGAWVRISSIDPRDPRFRDTDPEFLVRLDREGTYDFAIQTVYSGGRRPEPATADLRTDARVVVNTRGRTARPPGGPAVSARAVRNWAGHPGVEYRIDSPDLDPRSVVLEVRYYPSGGRWMRVTDKFDPADRDYAWELPPGERLEVRVRARDRAGNEAVSDPVITPPDGPAPAGGPPAGDGPQRGYARPDPRPRADVTVTPEKRILLPTEIQVGRSGVKEVTLYVRRPGAGGWMAAPNKLSKPGEDIPDAQAPSPSQEGVKWQRWELAYDAPEDGEYQFLAVATNNVGVGEGPPRDDDPPAAVVVVDTTPPELTIHSVRVTPGGDGGNVLSVTWDSRDANEADRPIYVEYGGTAEGPWQPLAPKAGETKGLEDTGVWSATAGKELPYTFFLQVKAVDRAGNVTRKVWTEPVVIDLFKPRTRIINSRGGGNP